MIRFQTDSAEQSFSLLTRLQNEGKYLAALARIEKLLQIASADRMDSLWQKKASLLSSCGDEAGALVAIDARNSARSTKLAAPAFLPGARLRDACEVIVKQAEKRQVVVLNEAHPISRHRAFGLSLLPYLKRLGFTYFAAETFNPPSVLQQSVARRTVTRSTGYYTSDPVFATYVQTALELGFTLVPYEIEESERSRSSEEQGNVRETAQANHLYERIFKKDPRAKVLVHVGYNHVMRTPDVWEEDGKKTEMIWMAGRLTKLLGMPLLTVDQTGGTEHGTRNAESARLRGILERRDLTRPSVVQKSDGTFLAEGIGEDCDLTVFHPRQRLRNGRPDWLLALPGRRAVPLPSTLRLPENRRVLLQAFRDGAPADAIDIDRFLINPGVPPPMLVLPKGRYRLSFQDEAGNIIDAGRITV